MSKSDSQKPTQISIKKIKQPKSRLDFIQKIWQQWMDGWMDGWMSAKEGKSAV